MAHGRRGWGLLAAQLQVDEMGGKEVDLVFKRQTGVQTYLSDNSTRYTPNKSSVGCLHSLR